MNDQTTNDSHDSDQEESGEGGILERGGVDADARAGASLGLDPREEPDEDTKQEIEEVRAERLDPDNRPDNAEVDNTQRDFDVDRGMFTDSEAYDESAPAPFSDPEDPNNPDNADRRDTSDGAGSSDGDAEEAS